MEITNLLAGLSNLRQSAEDIGPGSPRGKPAVEGRRDKISLSPEAMRRAAASTAGANEEIVRRQRVISIKARVDSGEYVVDSREVARKLVEKEPEFFLPAHLQPDQRGQE